MKYCMLAELPLLNAEQPTVTCELMGGLGNQLFILVATIAYALEHRLEFRLPRYEGMLGLDGSSRPAYWDSLLSNLQPDLLDDDHELEGVQPQIVNEQEEFAYHELPPPSGNDRWIRLRGYFQHPHYAGRHFPAILDRLQLPLDRYADDAAGCIALHFRLGDYKNVSSVHILSAQYYQDALRRLLNETTSRRRRPRLVKYAMQDKDEDHQAVARMLDQLRPQFPDLTFERLDPGMQDWEQLLFMARCDHNIVANSTFSWWAARLNPSASKVVTYPDPWFPGISMVAPETDANSGRWLAIPVVAA